MDKPANQSKGQDAIIVRLLGGLGNQMFQYALGRHLSIVHNRVLRLDLGFYQTVSERWASRSYGLKNFKIQAQMAIAGELKPFQKYLKQNLFSKILRRVSAFGKYYSRSYIFEPPGHNFMFEPELLSVSLKPVVYLDGFWQTEKYFTDIEQVIREDFKFAQEPDSVNLAMLGEIGRENSVAIHIRHGDNATKLARNHGVLPMDYYYRALKDLTGRITSPHFYIFSDDPEWSRQNLKLDFLATFVSHNGDEKNYEDLRLMAHCKHHIIGNSTFSWWGAWLGKKSGQLVYAPKRYHMQADIKPEDLYPANWNLIDI